MTIRALVAAALAAACSIPAGAAPSEPETAAPPSAAPAATAPAAEGEAVVRREERPNGLIVEDLVIGEGPELLAGGVFVARAVGKLPSGDVFYDSSITNQPIAQPLKNMIEGWQEGLPGMKRGGKRRLTIPPALAYGAQGRPPRIPPDATLTFVVELEDFLVVTDLTEGEGEPAPEGATVQINYKGMLENGQVFDTTEGRGPATFPLPQLIAGWQLGIPGMKPGGKRRLEIPYQFGYGEQGFPPQIPAKSRLIFEIELLSVVAGPGE